MYFIALVLLFWAGDLVSKLLDYLVCRVCSWADDPAAASQQWSSTWRPECHTEAGAESLELSPLSVDRLWLPTELHTGPQTVHGFH